MLFLLNVEKCSENLVGSYPWEDLLHPSVNQNMTASRKPNHNQYSVLQTPVDILEINFSCFTRYVFLQERLVWSVDYHLHQWIGSIAQP
uniref:Uncharacterized protein n=1 Tax=Nelumbo nucifera TaxID=4432 RepID=A0A822ZW99_NELNU|nr:TPA_asm: hypothetical protein HUJ06_017542 [Nelumbo nucifera]